MQPINYSIDVESPFKAALSGLEFGNAMAKVQADRQKEMLAQQQAMAEQEQKRRQQEFLQTFMSKPVKTAQDYAQATMMIPGLKDQFKQSWDMLNTAQQQNELKEASTIYSALSARKPDVAKNLLQTKITALENSGGDPAEIRATKAMLESIDIDPTFAMNQAGLYLASVPGGDKALEGFGKLGTERRAQEMQPIKVDQELAELEAKGWNIKNIKSQISEREKRLALDASKIQAETLAKLKEIADMEMRLPEGAQKLVNDAAQVASVSKQSAAQFTDLANRLDQAGGGFGAASTASEWLKKIGGVQGGMSQLRQEYTRLRNQAAIKSLPPGPATDRDIELALRGFPPETADAGYIASFLRGMAKLQEVDAAVANAKTDWLANNRGVLTRARTAFIAGDYSVRPGESFTDFSDRIAKDIGKRYKDGVRSSADLIPTPSNPNPGGESASIMEQADAILRGQ